MMTKLAAAALGQAPADILLKGASVVNVLNGEVVLTNVAIVGDWIAGVGDYHEAQEVVDLEGSFLIPGLIDARIQLESSRLNLPGFARAAIPYGTTTVIGDPEELINVLGWSGFLDLLRVEPVLPLDVYYPIPALAPAVEWPNLAVSPDSSRVAQVLRNYAHSNSFGEMSSFPEEYLKDPDFQEALEAAVTADAAAAAESADPALPASAQSSGKLPRVFVAPNDPIDGESACAREAAEKLFLGRHILIQEGSAVKYLDQILPLVTERNAADFSFCSGQRSAADLIAEGHIDNILRFAVAWGLDPVIAIRMATLNPASLYGLTDRGVIAPGYLADIAVVNSIHLFQVKQVYKRGVRVAENNKFSSPEGNGTARPGLPGENSAGPKLSLPSALRDKLNYAPPAGSTRARIIEVISARFNTRSGWQSIGALEPEYDIMKAAVIERANRGDRVGLGFVRGFGLKAGALASTVAHDQHNLIVIGADEEAMVLAAQTVAEMGGGLAVVSGNLKVLATLPLPIAGLMSDETAEKVALKHAEVNAAAQGLGCTIYDPFLTMAYLTLPVIPALKLTEQGLISINEESETQLVELWD
jgi:adenine deaminase